MKKFLDKIFFSIRYAFKNIIFGKLKSLALLITFIIVFTSSFLMITIKSVVSEYQYKKEEDRYYDFNLEMTVDENTNSRFFSIRDLENDKILDQAPFFKVNTLISSEKTDYVEVMTGSIRNLHKINKYIQSESLNIGEVIITTSVAKKFNLKEQDTINLEFDQPVEFVIKEIVEDHGLFRDSKVYIDKDSNFSLIMNALNLSSLPVTITKNLFNIVYLEVSDVNAAEEIKTISAYKNLKITETINEAIITKNIKQKTAAFWIMFVFIIIAILFVIHSTLAIMFSDRVNQVGIIQVLGGGKSFSLLVVFIEILIYNLISLVLGILISTVIINKGLALLKSDAVFSISSGHILFGFILILFTIVIIVLYYYFRTMKDSSISIIQANKIKKNYNYLIIFSVIAIIVVINFLVIKDIRLKASIWALIVIALALLFQKLLLLIGSLIKKKNMFSTLSIKNLNQNKKIGHNLNLMLIIFFSIVIVSLTIDFYAAFTKNVEKEIEADYLVMNVTSNVDATANEIKTMEKVEDAVPSLIFRDVILKGNMYIDFLVSVDNQEFDKYFDLEIKDDVLARFTSTTKNYILLPEKFELLENIEVGEVFNLYLNEEFSNEEFIVAGFYETSNIYIAYFNALSNPKYSSLAKNSILVNQQKDLDNDDLLQELITKYKSKLYFIASFDSLVLSILDSFNYLFDYLNYILYFFMLCFILTIFNNSILIFDELKQTYANIKILGMTNKSMIKMAVTENVYVLFTNLILVFLMTLGAVPNIKYISLYFGLYFPLPVEFSALIIGLLTSTVVFILSHIVYLFRISKIDMIENIKQY